MHKDHTFYSKQFTCDVLNYIAHYNINILSLIAWVNFLDSGVNCYFEENTLDIIGIYAVIVQRIQNFDKKKGNFI